jgi:hypothetical protein
MVGLAGVALPLLPTVVFWVLAALCWANSAPHWRRRLTAHPRYGAPIEEFLSGGTIPRRAKGYAVTGILFSGGLSSVALASFPRAVALLWALLAGVMGWLVTRPEPTAPPHAGPGESPEWPGRT